MARTQLREIKAGETGHGILVENDGFISSDLGNNKSLCESVSGDGGWNVPNPLVFDCVFQKCEIENGNKRIYPRKVLEREIANYQKRIADGRGYGECYTPDVLCLTEEGWKPLHEVKVGDKVSSLNPETNEVEFAEVINKIAYNLDDKLVHLKGENIDELVTPLHKLPLFSADGKFLEFRNAREFIDGFAGEGEYIPVASNPTIESKDPYIPAGAIEATEEDYYGPVECIDLDKNHIWFVMSNGKSHWTGNCNHPNEVVIDLSRICLNVEELHWEKNTVVGKVRIITSEGFRKNGIISCQGDQVANLVLSGLKVGVSSRGIGSIKQFMGKTVVQDDFELVCFDAVSDPSTPNAWICTSGKEGEKNMYIETKQTTKQNIDEQVEKLASLLD